MFNNILQMKTRAQLEAEIKELKKLSSETFEALKSIILVVQSFRKDVNKFDQEIIKAMNEACKLFEDKK